MTNLSLIDNARDNDRYKLLNEIARLIAKARSLKLPDSVFLLTVALLDLQSKIHNINDEELEAFSSAVRASVERH